MTWRLGTRWNTIDWKRSAISNQYIKRRKEVTIWQQKATEDTKNRFPVFCCWSLFLVVEVCINLNVANKNIILSISMKKSYDKTLMSERNICCLVIRQREVSSNSTEISALSVITPISLSHRILRKSIISSWFIELALRWCKFLILNASKMQYSLIFLLKELVAAAWIHRLWVC